MNGARIRQTLVLAVLAISVGAGAFVVRRGFRPRDVGNSAHLFDQVMEHVGKYYVDTLDVGMMYTKAAQGLVDELGDPHSVFLDSVRLARVQASITGIIGLLGLDVDVRDGWLTVTTALPNTPAEQVGLRSGDRIVTIDKRPTKEMTADEGRRALRGSPGTAVTVGVVRLGTAGQTELTMERESMYIRPVQRAMILNGTRGYVTLRTFSDSAALELTAAIDSLHNAGMRSLILDLRGNPGGLLAQGTAVADLFLDPGQKIVSLRGRAEDARDFVDEHEQRWKDLQLAVLVDRGTASAAEIVAGALQDHDRALVVGRPTYGKGSAQHVFSFHEQAGVKLTTARWYTPSGRNIDLLAPPSDSAAARGDTSRPVFKTDNGRKVYGGGGIVPDFIAGDSINAPRIPLFATLGPKIRAFRALILEEAKVIAARGVSDPMFVVTPEMRSAVYVRAQKAGIIIPRSTFDAASNWLDRQIGTLTVRVAFGTTEEARRQALRDMVVERAQRALDDPGSRIK